MQKSRNFIVAVGLLSLVGCAFAERRMQPHPTAPSAAAETGKPVALGTTEVAPAAPAVPKRVAVVLGPGGAKAFAHAGVLKELQRARIPVTDVVGMEWGALIGGLFSQKGQAHDMEWKLYKIEKQPLPGKGFFTSHLQAGKISDLRPYLQESFGAGLLSSAQVKFSCLSQVASTGERRWLENGLFSNSVEACLALPPLYQANTGSVAAPFVVNEAIERLRANGVEVIVAVNVLGPGTIFDGGQLSDNGASAILWHEIRRRFVEARSHVDYWIEVNTQGISLSDFDRRRDAVTAGETAGAVAAKELMGRYGF